LCAQAGPRLVTAESSVHRVPSPGARQLRRRSGCSSGTSTMRIRTPFGSAATSPAAPTAPPSAPAGSVCHARRAPVVPRPARAALATIAMPGAGASAARPDSCRTRHAGRRPSSGPAHRRTRGRWPAPACRGRTPGCAPDRLGAAARALTHPSRYGVTRDDCRPTSGLVIGLVEPPAGIEPATPSLPWNHQEPLCGPPFPQVTPDRRGRSYRFSFGEVMRSSFSRRPRGL
jgi:hypothetical protein